jgi:adenosine deaminase
MSTIVTTLPKIDLCCSLVGSMTHTLAAELMQERGMTANVADLLIGGSCAAWDASLDAFAALLVRPGNVEAIAYSLAQRLISEAVVHAEVHVDPRRPALPIDAVFDAIERGFERAIEDSEDALLSWVVIAEVRRGDDAQRFADDLEAMREAMGSRLAAVALTGDEGTPLGDLGPVLDRARDSGLRLVVTAGYGGNRKTADEALALEPARVVHGHRLPRDDDALTLLRARRVPIICLPTLEMHCGLVRPGAPPSLVRLLESGLFATIASGAPGLLKTTMTRELEGLSQAMGWRLEQMRTGTARAVEAAFIDPKLRFVVARAVENWRHRPRLTAGPTDDGYSLG